MAINFDANASLGLLAEVKHKLIEKFGSELNPSSVHAGGQKARLLLEESREFVREFFALGSDYQIVFTSGATEANNLAILSPFWHYLKNGAEKLAGSNHIVASSVEHPSALEPCLRLQAMGFNLMQISPSRQGRISSDHFLEACSKETHLVCLMLANNETGAVHPVAETSKAIKMRFPNTFIHCDAVQAIGKMEVNWSDLEVDSFSISGHKIGALTGVGALIVKSDYELKPLLLGGPQEKHFRAGTENLMGIYSLALALSRQKSEIKNNISNMKEAKQKIKTQLQREFNEVVFNADFDESLPNTISATFPGLNADDLVVALDLEGILVSSGAACSSGKPDPSHVLLAMGLEQDLAKSTIRVSLKPNYTDDELETGIDRLVRVISSFRGEP